MLLDVHQGAATSFDQEIVALDETGAAASGGAAAGGAAPLCRLGKLQRRIVVTPNLDDLLARCAEEEAQAKQGQAALQPAAQAAARRKGAARAEAAR